MVWTFTRYIFRSFLSRSTHASLYLRTCKTSVYLDLWRCLTNSFACFQCRAVKISIFGEPVPVQVDGEAWMQPPGYIKIVHKNRAQMLVRDRVRWPSELKKHLQNDVILPVSSYFFNLSKTKFCECSFFVRKWKERLRSFALYKWPKYRKELIVRLSHQNWFLESAGEQIELPDRTVSACSKANQSLQRLSPFSKKIKLLLFQLVALVVKCNHFKRKSFYYFPFCSIDTTVESRVTERPCVLWLAVLKCIVFNFWFAHSLFAVCVN